MVNGEPVMFVDGGGCNSKTRNASNGYKRGRHTQGNVTGVALNEFIALPPRSKVSFTYDGPEDTEAFLCLHKL